MWNPGFVVCLHLIFFFTDALRTILWENFSIIQNHLNLKDMFAFKKANPLYFHLFNSILFDEAIYLAEEMSILSIVSRWYVYLSIVEMERILMWGFHTMISSIAAVPSIKPKYFK